MNKDDCSAFTYNYKSKIYNCLSWIVKKYLSLHKEISTISAYKIIDIKYINNECELIIQINGTGKIITQSPKKIITDHHFIKSFSIKDIETIYSIIFNEINKPKYQIISYNFSEKKGKIILYVKDFNTGIIKNFIVSELVNEKEILQKFSSKDAYRIGYLHGYEGS